MSELAPYLFYVFVGIALSRFFVILLARRVAEKTPGEELMARLHLVASRDFQSARDAASACLALVRQGGIHKPTFWFALTHLCLWVVLGVLFAVVGLAQVFRSP